MTCCYVSLLNALFVTNDAIFPLCGDPLLVIDSTSCGFTLRYTILCDTILDHFQIWTVLALQIKIFFDTIVKLIAELIVHVKPLVSNAYIFSNAILSRIFVTIFIQPLINIFKKICCKIKASMLSSDLHSFEHVGRNNKMQFLKQVK